VPSFPAKGKRVNVAAMRQARLGAGRVQASAPAVTAKASASCGDLPSIRATVSAAVNVSPAPTVSTTLTFGGAARAISLPSL
jgi:hypothetical protein